MTRRASSHTPAPVADFGLTPVEPSPADDVRLYDFSYDPGGVGIATRSWTFGDGDTSTKVSPRHRFETEGTYEVRLAVTTFDGRENSTARTVLVQTPRRESSCTEPGST